MLAWSEGTDNGCQKTRNHGDVIVGGELFTDYLITSQPGHAKPKLKSTGAGRYQLLPVGGCSLQAVWPERLLSEKSGTLWHCSRLAMWRFTYDWSWWYPSGNRPLQHIPLHCRALVIPFEHKADSLIAPKKRRNGQRDWCMSRVTAIISALVICIIVRLSWAVNHYRDNAITYKAQRDKCQRTEAGERGNYWHADASCGCCCARCKIHEGVSWC